LEEIKSETHVRKLNISANSLVFPTQLTLSSYQVYGTFCQKQQQPPITRGQPFSEEIDKFAFCVV